MENIQTSAFFFFFNLYFFLFFSRLVFSPRGVFFLAPPVWKHVLPFSCSAFLHG